MNLRLWYTPIDEGILGEKAVPMSGEETHEEPVKEDQPSTSKAVRKIIPTLVTTEVKKEVKPQVQPRLLSDTILDAMGPGDEECMVTRIKRGRDPFYDLTQDDEELKQAFAEVGPKIYLRRNRMLMTFQWLAWKQLMRLEVRKLADCSLPMQSLK